MQCVADASGEMPYRRVDSLSWINHEREHGNASDQHRVIRSVFEDANNYMKSGTQMLAVIEKLEDAINFHDFKTRANLGDVYEQLLNDLRGAGKPSVACSAATSCS